MTPPNATFRGPTTPTLFKVGLALVSALLLTATGWWTWRDFEDARYDAEAQLSAATLIVKGHAVRSLEAIDTALASVSELVEREGVEAFRSEAQSQRLRQAARHLPATAEIFVVDANDDLVAASRSALAVSVSDREWFQQLKTGTEEIHIGRALKGRDVHDIFFPVARALRRPDGAFAGAVQVGVDVSYLAALLKDLGLGPGAAIGIFRARDGALIARHPMTAALLNQATGPFFAVLGEAANWTGWLRDGGEDRLLFVRRAEEAPLIACASVPKREVYAAAWNRLPERLLAVAAIWGALLALTVLAVRQAQREASFRSLLTASDARFREMADHAPVMVWVTEPDGGCSFLSRAWYEFTGQTPEAALGRGWQDAVHGDDRRQMLQSARAPRSRRETFQAEYRLRRHDDAYKWVLAAAAPRFDRHGEFLGYIGSVIDISQRKETEAELEESEARYRALYHANPAMYFTVDAAGTVLSVNTSGAGELGYSPDELIGRSVLEVIHEEDRETAQRHLSWRLEHPDTMASMELRKVRRDGSHLWVREVSRAVHSAGQSIILIVCEDITDLKRAEERQNLLIAELDHRVKNVLARVVAMVERTRESYSAIDDYRAALTGRIRSMANAHALLSRNRWRGVALGEIVGQELAPYTAGGNVTSCGPEVVLLPEAGQVIATVLHELTTNAAKYGALSIAGGRVAVSWGFTHGEIKAWLALIWEERGGPPVTTVSRIGFGTRVIKNAVCHQLDGQVNLEYAAEGIRCTIELPCNRVDHGRSS